VSHCLLVLEDGTASPGRSFGAPGTTLGEVVFTTGMTGYQETLTDPSYAGQILVATSPQQGNYGVRPEEAESGRVQVAGFVAREAARRSSGRPGRGELGDLLEEAGVPAIEGVDTRALTLRIRSRGAMRGGISTEESDPHALLEQVLAIPGMEGAELAAGVSTEAPYEVGPAASSAPVPRVAAYDWGLKRSILGRLAAAGCHTTVLPAATPAQEVLAGGFDGVFLSNGPGDPAATRDAIGIARRLLGRIPVFGICLGHQILGLAAGGRSFKLRFGHRGSNQPVRDLEAGRVEVTTHNHGFALDPAGFGGGARSAPAPGAPAPVVASSAGRVALTHWNLNDGTLEGMRFLDVPAFSVQYHPEAAPGPHDAAHLFSRFRALMAGRGTG